MYEKNPERKFFFKAEITFNGKGGHSSVPYHSKNPVLPAFALLQSINEKLLYSFTSFQNIALFPVLMDAGSQQNIIPPSSTLVLRGEASDKNDSDQLQNLLGESLKAIEKLYEVSVQTKIEAVNE